MAQVSVAPAALDLEVVRGDDFDLVLTFQDDAEPPAALNLSDSSWAAQVRQASNSAAAAAVFTVDTTDAATGVLVLSLDATATADLSAGVWDLQRTYTADGHVVTLLAGQVSVVRDVTR